MRTSPARALERALWLVTAAGCLATGWSLLYTPALPETAVPPVGVDRSGGLPSDPAAGAPDGVDAIVAANIFSPSRRAPDRRYSPNEPAEEVFVPVEPETVAGEYAMAAEPSVPQLFGTLLGPAGPVALLRLDPELPDPQLYREGDHAGGYGVVKINRESVLLSGPEGRLELRLPHPDQPAQ